MNNNSAAPVRVQKMFCKMKGVFVWGCFWGFFLVVVFFFLFGFCLFVWVWFFVVSEGWFQETDPVANRLRYPCSNVSHPSAALGVMWREYEPRLRVHQRFLGMAGISCIWNGSALAIAQAGFNFLLHICCYVRNHPIAVLVPPVQALSSTKILICCLSDLRESG